jgi:hypothetical protein
MKGDGQMDRREEPRRSFDWLPAHMPGVAKLMATKRAQMGMEHINECWRRGVLGCEPGWFYAREGPLAVGVPWPEALAIHDDLNLAWSAKHSLLVVKAVEVAHG